MLYYIITNNERVMSMYETLAGLYDYYMDEVPYEKWLENIKYFFGKYKKNVKTV